MTSRIVSLPSVTSGAVTQVVFAAHLVSIGSISNQTVYILDSGIFGRGGRGHASGLALHHRIALGTALGLEFSNLRSAVASQLGAGVSGDLGFCELAKKMGKAVDVPHERPTQRQGACQSRHDRRDGLVGISALGAA